MGKFQRPAVQHSDYSFFKKRYCALKFSEDRCNVKCSYQNKRNKMTQGKMEVKDIALIMVAQIVYVNSV